MPERPAGKVEHYYPKVQAAAVRLTRKVKLGDRVHIVGHGDDVEERVTSLQMDRRPIQEGMPGQSVGLWVMDRVHAGDEVFLVEPAKSKAKAARMAKPRKAASRPKRAKRMRMAKARKPAKPHKAAKAKPRKARKARKAAARKKR